jgi:hypothetical protein
MKKLLLGIPTYKSICARAFAYQMGMLLDGVNSGLVKRLEVDCDMYVTMARNTMCKGAIEGWKRGEITHLLMVDDDVLIPPGGIAKLASHDFPVVSGVYYNSNLDPVVYDLNPFTLYKIIPSSGIIDADGVGGGCVLIDCALLQQMAEKFGNEWWFQNQIVASDVKDKAETYLGEDVFFFMQLKKMGIRVKVDCGVQCGHLGVAIADRGIYEIKHGIRKVEFKSNV